MEESKYYTPDIEDLFIGYECEMENNCNFELDNAYKPYKMEFEYRWLEISEEFNLRLRTKYLNI